MSWNYHTNCKAYYGSLLKLCKYTYLHDIKKNYTNTLSLGEMGQRKNKQQVTKTHVLHTHYDMKKEMKNERKWEKLWCVLCIMCLIVVGVGGLLCGSFIQL